ncbi:MAG: hypothetical protein JSS65_09065 [Armatimonadetes bacterium]|nr:hypothetical protein [Armatimonadota bacterium]
MFADRVMATPWVFVLGCLVWVPVCVWTVSMVGWLVNGDIEVVYGVPALLVVLAMGFLTTRPPDPALSPFLFVGVLGTVVMYPVVRKSLEGRAHVKIDLELLSGAYATLESKPDTMGPRIRMAEIVAARGMYATAVKLMEPIVATMTPSIFSGELKSYASWQAMVWDANAYAPVACPACGVRNQPGELYCQRCQGQFVLDRARVAWLGAGISRRLLSAWMFGSLVVVGIPVVAQAGLPPLLTGLLVVAMMAGGIVVLVRAFGERGA